MNTLVKTRRKNQVDNTKFRRAYVPTTALAKVVKLDEELMHVHLTDEDLSIVSLMASVDWEAA